MLSFKVKSLIYENASELLYNLDTASVREKIANAICRYSDIFPYKSVDDVIKVLKDNSESSESRLLMCLLMKDPKKQNTSENEFFKFVNSGRTEYIVEKLPQSGKNAIIFPGCKAADFKISGTNIIGTQKYTKGIGGAQDNQYMDVVNSLEYVKNNTQYKFIAALDGDYYNKERLELLNNKYKSFKNIKIFNADDLKKFLENKCIW